MGQTLIRNATIVTMEPGIGDLEGDILVDGERIVEIRKGIAAPGAEVVDGTGRIAMPGLVNAHIHTWEYQLRGIGAGWVSSRDYHGNMHQNLVFAFLYNAAGVPIAAGVLYPAFGLLLSPLIAALAMSFSSASVVGNALRLGRKRI